MTKTETTPKSEPAIRELSAEELMQASGAGVAIPDRRGSDIWVQRGIIVQ
jgi:hypothetical protein